MGFWRFQGISAADENVPALADNKLTFQQLHFSMKKLLLLAPVPFLFLTSCETTGEDPMDRSPFAWSKVNEHIENEREYDRDVQWYSAP